MQTKCRRVLKIDRWNFRLAIATVAELIQRRVLRYLVRHDCLDADDAEAMLTWQHSGFSVDAHVTIAEHDRAGLARLSRYCARHPFAKGRLSRTEEQVVYQLAKPDIHGNTALALSPLELFDKLAALIIPPRVHRNSYWGAFAPHSAMRPYVVLLAGETACADADSAARSEAVSGTPADTAADTTDDDHVVGGGGGLVSLWACMLAKIYEVLPIVCRSCGHEMKPVAVIVDRESLARICSYHGQPHKTPQLAPARGPPQGEFDFD